MSGTWRTTRRLRADPPNGNSAGIALHSGCFGSIALHSFT